MKFCDIVPLFIDAGSRWVHPNIHHLAKMQEVELDGGVMVDSTVQLFRVYLKADGKTVFVVFKSKDMTALLKDVLRGRRKFSLTDEEWNDLGSALFAVLLEDVWVPHTVQFMKYDIYKSLQFLNDGFSIDFLSPDVVLTRLEDGSYAMES